MGITYWVDVTDYEKIRLEYYASRPIIAVIVIFVGAGMSMDNAWALADITMAFMCLTNIPSIMAMNKTAIAVMKDYGRQLAEGKKPVFKAKILVSTTPILTSGNKLLHPFLTKLRLRSFFFHGHKK